MGPDTFRCSIEEHLKARIRTLNPDEKQVWDPKSGDLTPKMKGFDPKPLKNAGFGPLATHFATVTPLGIKYTYDIYIYIY